MIDVIYNKDMNCLIERVPVDKVVGGYKTTINGSTWYVFYIKCADGYARNRIANSLSVEYAKQLRDVVKVIEDRYIIKLKFDKENELEQFIRKHIDLYPSEEPCVYLIQSDFDADNVDNLVAAKLFLNSFYGAKVTRRAIAERKRKFKDYFPGYTYTFKKKEEGIEMKHAKKEEKKDEKEEFYIYTPSWSVCYIKAPEAIETVHFNEKKGITTIKWVDGAISQAKCGPNDIFDREKGMAIAFMNRFFPDKKSANEFREKWGAKKKDDCGDCELNGVLAWDVHSKPIAKVNNGTIEPAKGDGDDSFF